MSVNKVHISDEDDHRKVSAERRDKILSELKRFLESHSMQNKEIARGLGVSVSSVTRYKKGQRLMSYYVFCKFCILFKVESHIQRKWFDILGWDLPDHDGNGSMKDQIIRKYMDYCHDYPEYTLKECMKELKSILRDPLTES